MNTLDLNIIVLGGVSCGKSTTINAFIGEQCSDTEIKKTTMMPQAYLETTNANADATVIRLANRQLNNLAMRAIEQNSFTIELCDPVYHDIDRISDLFDPAIIDASIRINICDTPGLNDSTSKHIYFEWVKQNIKKFDIIIFITDITKGLNTRDELDILDLILSSMSEHDEIQNICNQSQLICLMNKCDDIYFDYELNDLVFEEREQENIYIQANNILADTVRTHKVNPTRITAFLPISAENCFIYRALKKNPDYKLDPIHMMRLCKNECGSNQWKKMSPEDKEAMYQMVLQDLDTSYLSKITDTGYLAVKRVIQNTITSNIQTFANSQMDSIRRELAREPTDISDYIQRILSYQTRVEQLRQLSTQEQSEVNCSIYWSSFWTAIMSGLRRHVDTVNRSNVRIIKDNRFIPFTEFYSIHNRMQDYCINFHILMDVLKSMPEYPSADITICYSMIIDGLLSIYHQLYMIEDAHLYDHVRPCNIKLYLQVVQKYAKIHFYLFAKKLFRIAFNVKTAASQHEGELLELASYVLRTAATEKHCFNVYLAMIMKQLVARQALISSKHARSSFFYLRGIRRLIKSLPVSSTPSPIDVLSETTRKNISICISVNSITNIYRQDLDNTKIESLLDEFVNDDEALKFIDINYETELFGIIANAMKHDIEHQN